MADEKDNEQPDEFQKEFIDRFVPLARQFAFEHNAQQLWIRVYAAVAADCSFPDTAAAADKALEEFCKRFPQRVP